MVDAPTTVEGQSAADIVRGFDLNRLDVAFLNDPYPTYRACASSRRSTACPMDRFS
jgi:hypothetical protein